MKQEEIIRNVWRLVVLQIICCSSISSVYAQSSLIRPIPSQPTFKSNTLADTVHRDSIRQGQLIVPPSGNAVLTTVTPNDSILKQFFLPSMVLLFGLMFLVIRLIADRQNMKKSPDGAIKIDTIILITVGVLFIISMGNQINSSEKASQLYAPAFGLLGTLVGYIFGRSASERSEQSEEPKSLSKSQEKTANQIEIK